MENESVVVVTRIYDAVSQEEGRADGARVPR